MAPGMRGDVANFVVENDYVLRPIVETMLRASL